MALPGSVLVVGGDGLVGAALVRRLNAAGAHVLSTSRRAASSAAFQLDLATPEAWPVLPVVDVAVLCAAIPSINACAEDPEATAAVNVGGLSALAERLAERAGMVLLLSSNQVFDGRFARRDRSDAPCPSGEYGRQKAAVESNVLGLKGGAVLRLTKVLTHNIPVLSSWCDALAAGQPIKPFDNFPLAPVTLDFAVETIIDIVSHGVPGIYQSSGADDLTYVDLAMVLARCMGADPALIVPAKAEPSQLGFENLPRYSSLEMEVEGARFGRNAPASDSVLEEVVRSLTIPGAAVAHG